MSKATKIFIGTVVGVAVIGTASYVGGLFRTSAELETVTKTMIHSLKLDGLTIRLDIQMKNPTSGKLKIKYPFVKIYYKSQMIGSTKVIDKDILIPANGEANINQMMLNIPATSLLALGGGLKNVLTKKEGLQLTVKTISTIDLGWKRIPYQKSEQFNLKPKVNGSK